MQDRHLVVSLCVVCLTAATVVAQDMNVTVQSRLDTRGRLSGVWGYVAADGREFAVVGEYSGTWVVETTDPKNPVERGHFSAARSNWREITSYKNYIYSASEHHRGIRIIDMANPANPVDKGVVLTANITRTHSISVDPGTGRIYANGTNLGMVILDVKTNPLAPKILGTFRASYVHDSFIRRGRGYLCNISSGNLTIFDVTNPASFKQISVFSTPGRTTHNCWTTADDKLLVTTDEIGSGGLTVYDISTPTNPVLKGTYKYGSADICHNAFLMGRTCYMAYNSAGFHVADLSDPTKPYRLASFDTSTSTSGYNGAWGGYPFQDSGIVYIADRVNGLYCMQVDCGHMNRYGAGSSGTGNAIPRVHFDGASPRVGASRLELRVTNLEANAPFWIVIAARSVAPVTVLGVEVHIDLTGAIWVQAKADANGAAVLPAPIPNNGALGGAKVYMQLFAADSKAAGGFSATRGMWTGICK